MIVAIAFLSGVFLGPAVRYEARRIEPYLPHVYVVPPRPTYRHHGYRQMPPPPYYYEGR